MLYYRVKPEADQKPMLIRKCGRNEVWSVYVKGELFTPNEALRKGLNRDYLEAVDVNQRRTQKIFGVRMPTSNASITPAKSNQKQEVSSNAEIESIARFIVHSRPDHPNERGSFTYTRGASSTAGSASSATAGNGAAVRDTRQRNTPHRIRRRKEA